METLQKKKKKINHFPVVNFDFYKNHIFHLEGRISKQLLTMANKQIRNHQELLASKWKEISGSKQTLWVCNFLQFHYRITITNLIPPAPKSMNSFTVSKSYRENKNVSSTTGKQIKPTKNTLFVRLLVLTSWGPDS